MTNAIKLEKLKPEEIVQVAMNSEGIVHVSYQYPILDADMDYKVALYINKEAKKIEKTYNKCAGLLIDISNYNRLDCTKFFDLAIPSPKARELHSRMYKEQKVKRIAFCKKDTSRLAELCVKMAAIYHGREVKLFSNSEKAVRWLKEGITAEKENQS